MQKLDKVRKAGLLGRSMEGPTAYLQALCGLARSAIQLDSVFIRIMERRLSRGHVRVSVASASQRSRRLDQAP